jgi:pyocin large subunit-like protein
MAVRKGLCVSAALAGLLLATGCGREADKAARIESAPTGAAAGVQASDGARQASRVSYEPRRSERRASAAPFRDGKPLWAANRSRSGEENAQKQFDRNGGDFAAESLDAYVAKAHAFLDAPPKGVLKATRTNGDVLYYDARSNIFAVADRDGAPRTMFKPRDGMAYWTQTQQRLATQASDRSEGSDRGRRRYRARTSDEDSSG